MKNTTMDDPPAGLTLPLEWPTPPPSCGVCAVLVGQRSEARARDDLSRVSDLNVALRAHHPAPRRQKRR